MVHYGAFPALAIDAGIAGIQEEVIAAAAFTGYSRCFSQFRSTEDMPAELRLSILY